MATPVSTNQVGPGGSSSTVPPAVIIAMAMLTLLAIVGALRLPGLLFSPAPPASGSTSLGSSTTGVLGGHGH